MLALFTIIEANRKDSSMASSSEVLAKTKYQRKKRITVIGMFYQL